MTHPTPPLPLHPPGCRAAQRRRPNTDRYTAEVNQTITECTFPGVRGSASDCSVRRRHSDAGQTSPDAAESSASGPVGPSPAESARL